MDSRFRSGMVPGSSEDGIESGLGLVFAWWTPSVSKDAFSTVTLLVEFLAPERVWAGIMRGICREEIFDNWSA